MYSVNGKNYSTKYEIATDYGIPPATFYNRLSRGWSIEEALAGFRDTKNIEFNGKMYHSKKEAAYDNKLSINKFNRLYKAGKHSLEICIDGVYYHSKSEAIRLLKITRYELERLIQQSEDEKFEELGNIIIFDKKLQKKLSFINERSLCNYYNIDFQEFMKLFEKKEIQEIINELYDEGVI